MLIKNIKLADVALGRNWRLKKDGDKQVSLVDWEVEQCSNLKASDTIVYSALAVLATGVVRPLLLIREGDSPEWWGDTCEYVNGVWRELGQSDLKVEECFVADPLPDDPSWMGEYAHDRQKAGFAQWRDRIRQFR